MIESVGKICLTDEPAADPPGRQKQRVSRHRRQEPSDVQQHRAYASTAGGSPICQAEEQIRQQGIQPIASVDELAFPGVWESDEELEEFLADLYASRRANIA